LWIDGVILHTLGGKNNTVFLSPSFLCLSIVSPAERPILNVIPGKLAIASATRNPGISKTSGCHPKLFGAKSTGRHNGERAYIDLNSQEKTAPRVFSLLKNDAVAFTTPAVAKRINPFLIRALKLNRLAAIFSAGTVLADWHDRRAAKTRIGKITMKKTMPREKVRMIRDATQTVLLLLRPTVAARAASRRVMKTLLFSTLLSLFTVCAFSQDQAPAPVFKDGDLWQFKVTEHVANVSSTKELDGIYELVYSQGNVKAFELTGDKKVEVYLDPGDRSGTLLVLLGLNPKRPDLKFPLSVGQKWNYTYQFRPTGSRVVHPRNVEVHVVGIEPVITQAGTFRAFKIVIETNWSSGGKGPKVDSKVNHSRTTYFYSAESKSIVKSGGKGSVTSSNESKREIELIKFGSEDGRR